MIPGTFLWGILMVVEGGTLSEDQGHGWYLFDLAQGDSITARLIEEQEDSYTLLYEGSILQVEKKDLKGMRSADSVGGPARPPEKWIAGPPAGARVAGEGPPADRQEQNLYRDAIQNLALSDDSRTGKAYLLLSTHLTDARPLLHQALRHPDPILRARVVKLFEEHGNAKDDLRGVADRLSDPDPMVRLSAVLAVRALGPEGFDALTAYIDTEPVANQRWMAVRALGQWRDRRAVKPLVARFALERDKDVRVLIERTLEGLTGQKLGRDPAAWNAWLEEEETREALERILRFQEDGHGEGAPGGETDRAPGEMSGSPAGESRPTRGPAVPGPYIHIHRA